MNLQPNTFIPSLQSKFIVSVLQAAEKMGLSAFLLSEFKGDNLTDILAQVEREVNEGCAGKIELDLKDAIFNFRLVCRRLVEEENAAKSTGAGSAQSTSRPISQIHKIVAILAVMNAMGLSNFLIQGVRGSDIQNVVALVTQQVDEGKAGTVELKLADAIEAFNDVCLRLLESNNLQDAIQPFITFATDVDGN